MPVPVGRGEVQALLAQGALLVDVMDPAEFARSHLPGAVNVPLAELTGETFAALDDDRPVIVYGAGLSCDRGPRAARILEHNGFTDVHDYEAGKEDWLAYGLPFAGDGTVLAVHLLDPCLRAPEDELSSSLLDRMNAHGENTAVIVDAGDIVMGTVERSALEPLTEPVAAGSLADPDPLTARPSELASSLGELLARSGRPHAFITTSSGRLLGQVSADRLQDTEAVPPSSTDEAASLAPLAAAG